MNLNKILYKVLGDTGLPVRQDEYVDADEHESYIIFTYEDERPVAYSNNRPFADTAYLQVQLVTPKGFNYFQLKEKIRDLLEGADFSVRSIRSFLGSAYVGTEKIRQTIFHVEYTQGRR